MNWYKRANSFLIEQIYQLLLQADSDPMTQANLDEHVITDNAINISEIVESAKLKLFQNTKQPILNEAQNRIVNDVLMMAGTMEGNLEQAPETEMAPALESV
jgi:hypothetical protein